VLHQSTANHSSFFVVFFDFHLYQAVGLHAVKTS